MALTVQAAKDPWWANLAVNVLGGLWNDLQQREANKKANAFFGALNEEYDKLSGNGTQGGLTAAPEQNDAGQGLLSANIPEGYNSNGWASAFHKSDSPLSQFNNGVTGLLGASASPTATTASAQKQTQTIPSPMDFYSAAMGLAATKRFAMMNPDTVQNMITPYLKLNEAARQEQMRNDLARDYESATDAAGRKNVAARGLINQTIDNGAFSGLVGANAVTPMNLDLGGSILPSTFDAWSGKMTYGDKWDKGLTPQDVANIAQQEAARRENARQFDATLGYNRENAAWERAYKNRVLDEQGRQIRQVQLMPDGHVYGITQNGEAKRLSTMPGLTDVQKETLNRKEERIKTLTKMREGLVSNRNVYVNKGVDTADLDKQITEIDAEIEKTNGEIQSIVNSLNTQGGSTAGQKMTISVNYETLKNNYSKYKTIIDDNAKKHNVDPELITAIIQVESNWKPHAVSGAGARGMMQLMPKTARYVGVNNSYDVAQNIAGGTRYIAEMLKRYDGNIEKALWAYNAGPGNADKGRMPAETRKYIANVMGIYSQLMGWRDAPELKPNTFVGVASFTPDEAASLTVEGRRKATTVAYRHPKTGEVITQSDLETLEQGADRGEGKFKNREELYNSLREQGYVKVENGNKSNTQSQTPPTSSSTATHAVTPDIAVKEASRVNQVQQNNDPVAWRNDATGKTLSRKEYEQLVQDMYNGKLEVKTNWDLDRSLEAQGYHMEVSSPQETNLIAERRKSIQQRRAREDAELQQRAMAEAAKDRLYAEGNNNLAKPETVASDPAEQSIQNAVDKLNGEFAGWDGYAENFNPQNFLSGQYQYPYIDLLDRETLYDNPMDGTMPIPTLPLDYSPFDPRYFMLASNRRMSPLLGIYSQNMRG